MNTSALYAKWRPWLMQHIPDTCSTRLTNLLHLMVGLFVAQSVHLHRIAKHILVRAKKLSLARRLRRFLDNANVCAEAWYRPHAQWLLRSAANAGQINLIVDGSRVSANKQLLCIAIAYQRRALPIIWTWVPYKRGHSGAQRQLALLARLQALLPVDLAGVGVSVVGDSEFGHVLVVEQLRFWGWAYGLRQAKDSKVLLADADDWCALQDLPIAPGGVCYYRDVRLTHAAHASGHCVAPG